MCPVCGFPELSEPPYDEHGCASFGICPCCGTEFGYDDATRPHAELRKSWLAVGTPWRSKTTNPPIDWNAQQQLRKAGFSD